MKKKYNLYLAADYKDDIVSGNPLYSGTIAPIEGKLTIHHVSNAQKLSTGCMLVKNTTPLFWELANYKVSSVCGDYLILVPVQGREDE